MQKIFLFLRFLSNKYIATKILIHAFPQKIFSAAVRSNNFFMVKSVAETCFVSADNSIFCAFKNNYNEILYYLFEKKIYPPDCQSSYVKWAAKNDKLDVFEFFEDEDKIKYIIRYGRFNFLEKHWPKEYSPTCLIKDAVIEKQLELVRYLVNKGADPNEEDVLEIAIVNNCLDIIKVLAGADLRRLDDLPLQLAADFGHFEIVRYLVENGADPKSENNAAVGLAVKSGFIEIVDYLVSKGGEIPEITELSNIRNKKKIHKIIYFQNFKRPRRYF